MSDIEAVAEAAAEKAVAKTFMAFGLDPSDPLAAQRDFAFLRDARLGAGLVRRYTVRALVSLVVTAIGTAVWLALKSTGKAG